MPLYNSDVYISIVAPNISLAYPSYSNFVQTNDQRSSQRNSIFFFRPIQREEVSSLVPAGFAVIHHPPLRACSCPQRRPSDQLGGECTGTSVTLWTGHVRYKSLTLLGLSFGLGLVLAFVSKYLTGRRGRGNVGIPTGFPKSVGRVGQAGFMAFHAFHTLSFPWPVLGNTYSKTTVSTEARFRQQEPLVPDSRLFGNLP
jgi:hypothetical protein